MRILNSSTRLSTVAVSRSTFSCTSTFDSPAAVVGDVTGGVVAIGAELEVGVGVELGASVGVLAGVVVAEAVNSAIAANDAGWVFAIVGIVLAEGN